MVAKFTRYINCSVCYQVGSGFGLTVAVPILPHWGAEMAGSRMERDDLSDYRNLQGILFDEAP